MLYSLWAKTRGGETHCLLYHMIDVAAVTMTMWEYSPRAWG